MAGGGRRRRLTVPLRLPESLTAYRIGDSEGRWPVFSSDGARWVSGRWHDVGDPDTIPGWQLPDSSSARRFGHRWYAEGRSAILIVPSVVVRLERNIIVNASHPEFQGLKPGAETPVWWDERLFG